MPVKSEGSPDYSAAYISSTNFVAAPASTVTPLEGYKVNAQGEVTTATVALADIGGPTVVGGAFTTAGAMEISTSFSLGTITFAEDGTIAADGSSILSSGAGVNNVGTVNNNGFGMQFDFTGNGLSLIHI